MPLPPHFLDQLRDRVVLSEVVGRRVPLTRAGRELKACCPFHTEKTPSFTVNDRKGFFHCFGCGAHGDVIGFVMRHDRLGFLEAVELLAGQAGLEVPRPTPQERARFEQQKGLHELIEAACRFFEAQLRTPAGRAALDHLRGRGLDDETIARFRLGYAPADGRALLRALGEQGFGEAAVIEAGLARTPEPGADRAAPRPYAFFRHRVMFPVGDRRGRVVAFGARKLEGDGPKYLNSPDGPLFHKGQLLFNLSRARMAAGPEAVAGEAQPVIVAEGYMDVIALARAGFAAAVAPLGTALTEAQILELWRLDRLPILCFDGDEAGRRAAWRAAERVLPLLKPDHSVRVAFMPPGEDPDTLLRTRGRAAMQTVLDEAMPLIDFVWSTIRGETVSSTPEAKAAIPLRLSRLAYTIQDPVIRKLYSRQLHDRFYQQGRRQLGFVARGHHAKPVDESPVKGVKRPTNDVLLVASLIHEPAVYGDFIENVQEVFFENEYTDAVFNIAVRFIEDEQVSDGELLQNMLVELDENLRDVVNAMRLHYKTHVNRKGREPSYQRAVFLDILRSSQIVRIERELQSIDCDGDNHRGDEEAARRLRRYQFLEAERRRLLSEQDYLLNGDFPEPSYQGSAAA